MNKKNLIFYGAMIIFVIVVAVRMIQIEMKVETTWSTVLKESPNQIKESQNKFKNSLKKLEERVK